MSDLKKCDIKNCGEIIDGDYFQVSIHESSMGSPRDSHGEWKDVCLVCARDLFGIEREVE